MGGLPDASEPATFRFGISISSPSICQLMRAEHALIETRCGFRLAFHSASVDSIRQRFGFVFIGALIKVLIESCLIEPNRLISD